MQPHPMTSVMQLTVTAAAVVVAASAISFTVWTWREHRNADLVRIGVSVLRVDPEKEKQLSEATRKWALDLIDANAGSVKFSPEAREQLLKKRLEFIPAYDSTFIPTYDSTYAPATENAPVKPALRRPSAEPPK